MKDEAYIQQEVLKATIKTLNSYKSRMERIDTVF